MQPFTSLTVHQAPVSPLSRTAPLWRVLSAASGRLVGYIAANEAAGGLRYRADRLRSTGDRIPLGDFADLDTALSAFQAV